MKAEETDAPSAEDEDQPNAAEAEDTPAAEAGEQAASGEIEGDGESPAAVEGGAERIADVE